jgi:hypothetical protein
VKSFRPHMETMPEAQKKLWPALGWTTGCGFVLYGGTAIALRYGHRASVDFDFFTDKPLNHQVIQKELKQSGITCQVVQDERNSLTVLTEPDDVKLSFFGGLDMGRVGEPTRTDDGLVCVASPLDLLATKLKVIMQRAEAKDYLDVAQLLRSGAILVEGLGAARAMYGPAFAPSECLRALTFFDDGDVTTVRAEVREVLRREAAAASHTFPIPPIHLESKHLSIESSSRMPDREQGDLDR